jgi:hypothetical protein
MSRPMMCFRLVCSFIRPLLTEIPSDAEVLLTLHLAPARITYPIGIVSYGVEIVSGFLELRPRALTDDFFGVLRDASVGYVIVVPRTLAKGVRV